MIGSMFSSPNLGCYSPSWMNDLQYLLSKMRAKVIHKVIYTKRNSQRHPTSNLLDSPYVSYNALGCLPYHVLFLNTNLSHPPFVVLEDDEEFEGEKILDSPSMWTNLVILSLKLLHVNGHDHLRNTRNSQSFHIVTIPTNPLTLQANVIRDMNI